MNEQQEAIFRRALQSHNPQAVLNVARAFHNLGEPMIADTLRRLAAALWKNRFGADYSQYYRAVQQKLNDLGATPPLKVDGLWGPKSTEALKTFQRANPPLVVDGKLGPKSLAALGITKPGEAPEPPPGGASPTGTDAQAYAVAKRANAELGLTEKEIQYVLTVARGEGGYGRGWGVAPTGAVKEFAEANGLTGLEGVGSNNWGAEQGSGDAGSFPHVDKHANGSMYIGKYKRWSTPEKGYTSVAKTVLSGLKRGAAGSAEIRDAINRGNLRDAVFAQHANGYFELAPEKYLAAVLKNYETIRYNVGWPKLLSELGITPGVAIAAGGAGVLAVLLVAAGVYFFGKKLF